MLLFIVLYAGGFLVTLEVSIVIMLINDADRPVIVSFARAIMWPFLATAYTWVGIKMFARHMLEELQA